MGLSRYYKILRRLEYFLIQSFFQAVFKQILEQVNAEQRKHVSKREEPSCLLYGPFDARFIDRPSPVLNNLHDVIVRIAYTGVCGSEVSNPSAHITLISSRSRTEVSSTRSTSGCTGESGPLFPKLNP